VLKLTILLTACWALGVQAQQSIVVPNSLASIPGDDANGYPFDLIGIGIRYQQVYAASQFTSLPSGGAIITAIAFRLHPGWSPFTETIPQIQIDCSTTTKVPDGLSTNFAANVGPDDRVVFNGPLTLSSAGGSPEPFDILITLATPFFYDPAAGNLLLDVRFPVGSVTGTPTPFDQANVAGDSVSRAYWTSVDSPSGVTDSIGLVTEFIFSAGKPKGLIGKNAAIKSDPGGVKILWAAEPDQSYMLMSSTNVAAPFSPTTDVSTNLTTLTNYNSVVIPTSGKARFFELFQYDKHGPKIVDIWPPNGAFGIYTNEAITARIIDETGLEMSSLSVSVGTNSSVWGSPGLFFTNHFLTYQPANGSWGPAGSNVTATLQVADELGNVTAVTWSFTIYTPPVLSKSVVYVDVNNPDTNSPGPHLTLLSAIGSNTLVYSCTGASSCLTNGMCLVNTNIGYRYSRVVRTFTDLPSNQVSVVTDPAGLSHIFSGGDLRLSAAYDPCVSFGNQTIYSHSNPDISIKTVPNAQICADGSVDADYSLTGLGFWLRPHVTISGDLALAAQVSAASKWSASGVLPLAKYPHRIEVFGVGVTASFTLDVPWSVSLDGTFSALAGFSFSETACYTAHFFRTYEGEPAAGDCSNPPSYTPIHSITGCGSATARVGLSPGFTFGLDDSVFGVQVFDLQAKVAFDAYLNAGISAYCGLVETSPGFTSSHQLIKADLCAGLDLILQGSYSLLEGAVSDKGTKTWPVIDCTPLDGFPYSADLGPCLNGCSPFTFTPPAPRRQWRPRYQIWNLPATPDVVPGAVEYCWGLMLGDYFLPFTHDNHTSNTKGNVFHLAGITPGDEGQYAVLVQTPGGKSLVRTELMVAPSPPSDFACVWRPEGTFTMGSPVSEAERRLDEDEHLVTISQGFYMAKYEVTQEKYFSVTGTNPSYHVDPSLPVENVSWNDATNYCGLLTQRLRQSGQIPTNWCFQLPSEAQWEYACRANGSEPPTTTTTLDTAFCYGSSLRGGWDNFYSLDEYDASVGTIAVTNRNYFAGQTTPVGSYLPSPIGLYDLHGNVCEWCSDWYAGYPTNSVIDPLGPATGAYRVCRGGRWNYPGALCRTAQRSSALPTTSDIGIGFRVVLTSCLPTVGVPGSTVGSIDPGSGTEDEVQSVADKGGVKR
jgi:formylglycine-generating enzyme required for sulfatase activity